MTRGRKERRRNVYSFYSLGMLYERYESRLPREDMIATVREAISAFIPRDGDNADDTRLQLVRKCEMSLRRRAESIEAGQPALGA